MHRVAVELPIMAIAAVVMAGMVLAIGSAIEPPTEPVVLPSGPVEPRSDNAVGCLDAPVTAPFASGAVGHARLCHDGRDLHVTLRVDGLAPGDVYSAWLGYAHQLASCRDAHCAPIDLPGERSAGLMQQVVGGAIPASHTVELDTSLRDVQLARGAQVSLLLLRPGGQAGPHAQAAFIIP